MAKASEIEYEVAYVSGEGSAAVDAALGASANGATGELVGAAIQVPSGAVAAPAGTASAAAAAASAATADTFVGVGTASCAPATAGTASGTPATMGAAPASAATAAAGVASSAPAGSTLAGSVSGATAAPGTPAPAASAALAGSTSGAAAPAAGTPGALAGAAASDRQSRKADKAFRQHVRSTYWRESNRWALVLYDIVVFALVYLLLFVAFPGRDYWAEPWLFARTGAIITACCIVGAFVTRTYRQVWRYAIYTAYLRLILGYLCGGCIAFGIIMVVPGPQISIMRVLASVCVALLGSIVIRLVYQLVTIKAGQPNARGAFLRSLLKLAGTSVGKDEFAPSQANESTVKVRVVIVGAGRVGSGLASDIWANPKSYYEPVCFVDCDPAKVGRIIAGLPVIAESRVSREILDDQDVQMVILALPLEDAAVKKQVFQKYHDMGRKVMTYDYPLGAPGAVGMSGEQGADATQRENGERRQGKASRRFVREFDIEELLFRDPITFDFNAMASHYEGRSVLITGGGGSIGSELCRQVAKMNPSKLVIVDIAENGSYDVQQELRMLYGSELDLTVEICNVCDRPALDRVFALHQPDVVLHAAAHKHVPLMERNAIEAVRNNVFGTLNVVELAEKHRVHRFIMVSTDKAVNPTNVMGATKRMCEMITQTHGRLAQMEGGSGTIFSATRFGNVLGSAGSVVPLFKKQILAGGPVTVTDRRIIRYFMTIPEATQLVLLSGTMAKAGELFVLDMGQPVRILDLAVNMITLMGFTPDVDIEIRETGLRPGEKLYEELLIRSEEMDQTENSRIFIERDAALSPEDLNERLDTLWEASCQGDENVMRAVLKMVVPTYKDPKEVNAVAAAALQLAEEARNAFGGSTGAGTSATVGTHSGLGAGLVAGSGSAAGALAGSGTGTGAGTGSFAAVGATPGAAGAPGAESAGGGTPLAAPARLDGTGTLLAAPKKEQGDNTCN